MKYESLLDGSQMIESRLVILCNKTIQMSNTCTFIICKHVMKAFSCRIFIILIINSMKISLEYFFSNYLLLLYLKCA